MSGSSAKKKRHPGIRGFIRQAISGQYEAKEIDAVLDLIEQGIGLDERDKALAEKFGDMPDDNQNPVFKRGWLDGHAQGLKDAGYIEPAEVVGEPGESGN